MNNRHNKCIVVRVDGGFERGYGHVYRMRNLVRALQILDVNVFIVSVDEPAVNEILAEFRDKLILLESKENEDRIIESILERFSICSLWIFDILNTENTWVRFLKSKGINVVSFDDAGEGRLQVDCVINALAGFNPEKDFIEKNIFNGVDYLIVSPEIFELRNSYQIQEEVKIVGITMGGADTYGVTPQIVNALALKSFQGKVIINLGPGFRHIEELNQIISTCNLDVDVYHSSENLHQLLMQCDLVISNGSITMLELCSIGIPMIGIANEHDEMFLLKYFAECSACVNMGIHNELSLDILAEKINQLSGDFNSRVKYSKNGKTILDGQALNRIVNMIEDLL